MNKLTASRCRVRINELRFTDNNHGLSNQAYDYLEALEIALPVLEQQGGWISCSERMPEPGVMVMVYTPPQPCDLPGDTRINFDWIDAESDNPNLWYQHSEQYEEYCHIATGEGSFGPSEIAPYTHWMPLPSSPQTQSFTTPQIDNDGWMEWSGGDCPVTPAVKVEYRLRGGAKGTEPAMILQWEHEGERHDIIAYRVIEKDGSAK